MQLPADALKNLKPVIDELANYTAPVAVVCFGHSSSVVHYESCFQHHSSQHYHYDLLVVQSNIHPLKNREMVGLVKSCFPKHFSVNVLCHSENAVRAALRDQHSFFCKVFTEGVVLFQAENKQFGFP